MEKTKSQSSLVDNQKALLEEAKTEGNPNKICEILGKLARTLIDDDQPEAALSYLDDAINLAEENQLIKIKATNLGNRGVALVQLKRIDEARDHFDQVEEIAENIDDPTLKCDALLQKAIMNYEMSRGDLVQDDLLKALEITKEILDYDREMKTCALLGHNHFSIASFDESAKYFKLSLELAQKTNNKVAQAGYHHNLGNVYYSAGVSGEAILHLLKAVKLFQEFGDKQGEVSAMLRLVRSYAENDEPEKTYETAKTGYMLAKKINNKNAFNSFFNLLLIASSHLGMLEDVLSLIDEAMEIAEKEEDAGRKLTLFVSRGNTYFELDKFEEAREAYLEGLDISIRLQNWELKTRILGRLGAIEADLNNLDKSIEYSKEALEVAKKVGNRRLIGEQFVMLAFGARDKGDIESAIEYVENAKENFSIIEAQEALEKLEQFVEELENN